MGDSIMAGARVTIRFDKAADAAVRRVAREQHISFNKAVNQLLLAGVAAQGRPAKSYRRPFPARRMETLVDYTSYARAIEALEGPLHA